MDHFENFYSKFVDFRNVDVWFPPGYEWEDNTRYPVLYMHDGQNLFDTATSYGGESWRVDQAITMLIDEGKIRGAIVVGVWNSPLRWREYLPQKPYESPALQKHHPLFLERAGGIIARLIIGNNNLRIGGVTASGYRPIAEIPCFKSAV